MIVLSAELPPNELSITWRNDSYATCRQPTLISEEHHQKWKESLIGNPKIKMFGIVDTEMMIVNMSNLKSRKNFVGQCGLTGIDHINRSAEYSILIGSEHRGRGYAKEAMRMLLRIAFDELNLNRVWGEVITNNPEGFNIALKLGFEEEGTLRQTYFKDGQYFGSKIVSILEKEYRECCLQS